MDVANKHRFTVEEYHKMAEAGVFEEDDRVELVEGEIVEMTPIGRRHMEAVNALNDLLAEFRKPGGYIISVQNPLILGERGEHQPDLALLRRDRDKERLPAAGDAMLVVEVADTSLRYDREVKLPLYARAGIPEAWLVDLQNDAIEVHTEPSPEGYKSVRKALRGESVVSAAVTEILIGVEEILG